LWPRGVLPQQDEGVAGRTEVRCRDDRTLETNVPGLFVAGAIVSGSDGSRVFIENGRFHGAAVVKMIVARDAARAARA